MAASRILFIRPSAFGDVLLTTPFLRHLRGREPGAAVELYSLHGQAWDPGAGRALSMRTHPLGEVLKRGYDAVYSFSYEHNPALHILDAYGLSTGLTPRDRTPVWTVLPGEARWAEAVLRGARGPLLGLHPASDQALRSLAPALVPELVRALRERFGATVVVTGRTRLGLEGCLDLTGRVSCLRAMGALIQRLDGLITIDSAPFHLAQALGVPTVAVFGATLPELRVTRTDRLQVVMRTELPCLGCYHAQGPGVESLSRCARGDLACAAPEAPVLLAALARAMAGEADPALAERLARYEARKPALLAAATGREATMEAFRSRLEALEARLCGLPRWRRRLGALFST